MILISLLAMNNKQAARMSVPKLLSQPPRGCVPLPDMHMDPQSIQASSSSLGVTAALGRGGRGGHRGLLMVENGDGGRPEHGKGGGESAGGSSSAIYS